MLKKIIIFPLVSVKTLRLQIKAREFLRKIYANQRNVHKQKR